MAITNLFSRSPWRITVLMDTAASQAPSDYTVARADGAGTTAAVNYVIPAGNVVELALSEQLLAGVIYQLTYLGSTTALVAYSQPLDQSPAAGYATDPEAEVFGVDLNWFANALTPSGDVPRIRGKQCLINDLATVALIQKGEIFHRPDTGAGMQQRSNGPASPAEVSSLTASLKREWAKDDRIRANGVTVQADISTVGQLTVSGTVQPLAVDDPLTVKVPGGST